MNTHQKCQTCGNFAMVLYGLSFGFTTVPHDRSDHGRAWPPSPCVPGSVSRPMSWMRRSKLRAPPQILEQLFISVHIHHPILARHQAVFLSIHMLQQKGMGLKPTEWFEREVFDISFTVQKPSSQRWFFAGFWGWTLDIPGSMLTSGWFHWGGPQAILGGNQGQSARVDIDRPRVDIAGVKGSLSMWKDVVTRCL